MMVNKKFKFALLGMILLVFVLNSGHINQQGVYENFFRQTADNVLSGAGYTSAEFDYKPAFYPIWGYTAVVIADSFFLSTNIIVYLAQALLCYLAVLSFFKMLNIEAKIYYLLYLLPFISLCSVKWPDAFVGCLLVMIAGYLTDYYRKKNYRSLIMAVIMFGLMANFRSEYVYLPFLLMILMVFSFYSSFPIVRLSSALFPEIKSIRKQIVISAVVLLAGGMIFLLPWSIRYYINKGEYKTGASNGWAVAYISLGQLPGNPWGIAPYDKSAFDFTAKYNLHPYTPEGDSKLKDEFFKLVKEHPVAFAEKTAYNAFHVLWGGVYTGEFANLVIGDERIMLENKITSAPGFKGKINAFLGLSALQIISLTIEKVIQFAFAIFFLYLSLYFIFKLFKNKGKSDFVLQFVIMILVFYKIAIAGLIQYEYRHMNPVYILILGYWLSMGGEEQFAVFFKSIFKKRALKQ